MIKGLCLDLDNTLVDLADVHYEALNKALVKHSFPPISREDHLYQYNGLPTTNKLKKLGLGDLAIIAVNQTKQIYTMCEIQKLQPDEKLIDIFEHLNSNYKDKMICVSNSIPDTVTEVLSRVGVLKYLKMVSPFFGVPAKPAPNIYQLAAQAIECYPNQCIAFEDNYNGILSSKRAGINVAYTPNPSFLTKEFIDMWIEIYNEI